MTTVRDQPLLIDVSGERATITLNRPQRRNALSFETLELLQSSLREVEDSSDVRVVVIRAEGPVFCAGHDLTELTDQGAEQLQTLFELCSSVMQQLRTMPQPVIAQVHALATAAGCQLVAACDLAVAAESASFATPGVQIGLFCSTPMVPLVRAIPPKAALEMLFTGTPIPAEEAHRLGLVNRVVPDADLESAVQALVEQIVKFSPSVVALGKRAFYDTLYKSESDAYAHTCEVMTRNAQMDDAHEGISAFLEKRTPQWSKS